MNLESADGLYNYHRQQIAQDRFFTYKPSSANT